MKFIFYNHNAILINILSLIGYFIKIEIYCYNCHKCKKKLERPVSRDYYKIVDNCHISINKTKFNDKIVILSALDNLIKGGAGQAIQNMNCKFNFRNNEGFK